MCRHYGIIHLCFAPWGISFVSDTTKIHKKSTIQNCIVLNSLTECLGFRLLINPYIINDKLCCEVLFVFNFFRDAKGYDYLFGNL
jgi:hypothetical protein